MEVINCGCLIGHYTYIYFKYSNLPEKIAMQFSFSGTPNTYYPKWLLYFFFPGVTIF